MTKKNDPASKIEELQKQAQAELTAVRKRIRKQKSISPLEYALLHEDSAADASDTACVIQLLLDRFSDMEEKLVLLRPPTGEGGTILATVGLNGVVLHPKGNWELRSIKSHEWDEKRPLPSLETKIEEMRTFVYETPLHEMIRNESGLIVEGETAIAHHLGEDKFDFFYRLTKLLGYKLKHKNHLELIKNERAGTESWCRQHLIDLKAIMDEIFFRGPKSESATKGHEADALIHRASHLATHMRRTLAACELYEVDTEESREIRAFGEKWITLFKL